MMSSADVDYPGSAQPDLLGDLSIGQAALAEPDHLPPALLLGCGRQLAHVYVPHALDLVVVGSSSRQ